MQKNAGEKKVLIHNIHLGVFRYEEHPIRSKSFYNGRHHSSLGYLQLFNFFTIIWVTSREAQSACCSALSVKFHYVVCHIPTSIPNVLS
jgi:hypothetical protein